jgi:hypothetical protein
MRSFQKVKMKRTIAGSVVLTCVLSALAQPPALKTFHDEKYDVTFRYSGQWVSGPDNRFDLVSTVVPYSSDDEGERPLGEVGFFLGQNARYAGTTLTDVQFLYNVIPQSTADACLMPLRDDARYRNEPLDEKTFHGIAYHHYSYSSAWTGHQALTEEFATFHAGRCYLFDESIHTASMEDARMLSKVEMKQLSRELNAVMQSVRIAVAP